MLETGVKQEGVSSAAMDIYKKSRQVQPFFMRAGGKGVGKGGG